MSEEEAKLKFCPVNALLRAEEIGGRPRVYCIGSACMAWRWAGPVPEIGGLGTADFAILVAGSDAQRAEQRARQEALRPGFCGLAGAPS